MSEMSDYHISSNTYGQHCYDATWILALALDNATEGAQEASMPMCSHVERDRVC